MMGSGFVFDAIQSMRNNKRIKKRNLDSLQAVKESEFIDYTKASPELLASIKEKMQKERKVARKKELIWILIFCIFMALLLFTLNHNWRWIEKFFYKVK